MLNLRNVTLSASARRLSRWERVKKTCPPGCTSLWTLSPDAATLLGSLSDELDLGWTLNPAARPDVLALTNLGQENPARLVSRCRPRRAVLCLDDRSGREFLTQSDLPCFTYSESREEADLTAHDLRQLPQGLTFLAVTKDGIARVWAPTGGLYTVLSTLACAVALGVPLPTAAKTITALLCEASKMSFATEKFL